LGSDQMRTAELSDIPSIRLFSDSAHSSKGAKTGYFQQLVHFTVEIFSLLSNGKCTHTSNILIRIILNNTFLCHKEFKHA